MRGCEREKRGGRGKGGGKGEEGGEGERKEPERGRGKGEEGKCSGQQYIPLIHITHGLREPP